MLLAVALALTGCMSELPNDAYTDGYEEDAVGDGGIGSTSEAIVLSNFQIPFACGSRWRGQTRTNHSLLYAVDFNRGSCDDDQGALVRAAKQGTVIATNYWTTSYGKHVIIRHGDGYTTLYAHLRGIRVSTGDTVRRGQVIGSVGKTGNAGSCTHLHYEMRRYGNDIKARFNGDLAHYWGERTYTSRNCN